MFYPNEIVKLVINMDQSLEYSSLSGKENCGLFHITGVPLLFIQAAQNQGLSLTELLLKASPVAKFVLLLLLVFSIVSWAIIFAKWRALKASQQDTNEFLERYKKSPKLSDLFVEAEFRKQ